jgi:pimeloyl-ACP methyl ester carboxylesterase
MTLHAPTPKSQLVVTLVHETFNFSLPEWTKPDSMLCSTLSQRFTYSANVFRWSGWNSHRARLNAAEKFKRNLEAIFDTFPDAKHFVVAHSHGGNIALYAMKDSELAKKIAGVVCLGTPFITCESRNIDTGIVPFQVIVSILVPISLIAILMLFLGWFANKYQNASFTGVLFVVIGVAGVFGAVFSLRLMAPLFRVVKKMVERHQLKLLSSLSAPRILSSPLLCISAKGDEAGRHLRFLE